MLRELLIVGTSGLAKEAAQLARRIDPASSLWREIAYVTNEPSELGRSLPFGKVVYTDEALVTRDTEADVVIGVGIPIPRRKIAQRLQQNPALSFPNLVHPNLEIDANLVTLGIGNMITQGVVMTCDIKVGDFNLLNWNCTIGHDVVIGSYNVINPGCSVSGRVHIDDACLLGTGCRVLETLNIVSEVKIGAGAVLTRSADVFGTYIGVPARLLRA